MRHELADKLLGQAGDLADPPVSWRGTDTYIQSEGINQDLGVYENPDDFYCVHGTHVSVWLLSPLIAALAMSLSSVSVIGNSLRLRR